ncbi:MAG: hypothetical protein K4571_20070 [Deltaproteobacteria bacterium]
MQDDIELKNGHYDSSIRKELEQADWKTLFPRLICFANTQCYKFRWLGNKHFQPLDLVQEAISLAFGLGKNGNYRNWNKDYYPDLISFLKGVIKSIVNHEIEHLAKFPCDSLDTDEEKNPGFLAVSNNNPESNLEDCEIDNEFSMRVQKLRSLADGDDEIGLVMMCFDDGITTPREIAEATGYDVTHIYNIIKRIKRRAKNI